MKIFEKSLFLSMLFVWLAGPLLGQTNPIKQAGSVNQATIEGQMVRLTTDQGVNINVIVYSPSIVRVRMDDEPLREDFSYAVITEPLQTNVAINETAEEISIRTDSLQARINKNPFAIAFYTPGGQLINKDEEGLTTSWAGEEVTTYKTMQEGERFIGLGEKFGGLDRRGNGYTNWNTDAYGYRTDQDPFIRPFLFI